VALEQGGKGRLVAPADEPLKQLGVGRLLVALGADQVANVTQDRAKLCLGHEPISPG
jgi:hypothetical protein